MRRRSVLGLAANLAAVGLVCAVGAAIAGPILPAELPGVIVGLSNSAIALNNAFVDTLHPILVSGAPTFYKVFATITSLLSGSVVSPQVSLIGDVLISAVQAIPSQGSGILAALDIFTVPSTLNLGGGQVFFEVVSVARIPEPNAIALVVTGVAGLAALLGRRRLRRRG